MVQLVEELPIPPKPSDPPAEFNQKASDVFDALFRAVPQMNQQAQDIEQMGEDADAAKVRAIAEADAAMGFRNEARGARDAALEHKNAAVASAGSASGSADAARGYAGAAEEAKVLARGYAAEMGTAINMAATFTAVPTNFKAWEIIVTLPHLRKMIWSAAQNKYIRAPWHQPCQLFFSYDNPSSIQGALPVRGDVSWNQADFPDVVERLGLSGTGTFTLVEARGEGVRVLDNGRGIDSGRVLRSAQLDAMQGHVHGFPMQVIGDAAGGSRNLQAGPNYPAINSTLGPITDGVNGTPRTSTETRMRNIAFPLWMTI